MDTVYSNPLRVGSFTSSEIFRLMKPGKAKGSYSVDADTYIQECNWERKLGRPIDNEVDARPLSWGRACEPIAFDRLPTDYTLCSDQTIQHPTIPYWVGSPDAVTEDACADLKCPMTLKSFCQIFEPYYDPKTGGLLHEAGTIEAVRENHRDGDKFFWQIVSNCVLTGKRKGRLIIFVPFEDELEEIRQSIEGNPDYYWIWTADKEKMPYLIRNGQYKNINVIDFDVLQRDVDELTNRVLECGKKLIPWPEKKAA